jgi:hypothetical protein
LSVSLFGLNLTLTPIMIDGDGLAHASRAMYEGFLSGMNPKHPLAAAVLRAIYLPIRALGLSRMALTAFVSISSLSAVGTLLLLACSLYPRFIRSRTVMLLCALAVVVSYGVFSRASTIEVYAPALFLDVALIAYCLRCPFTQYRNAVVASLMLIMAVGFHVTNLLLVPGVSALVIGRTPRERIVKTLLVGGTTFLWGIGVIVFLLWLGPGRAKWPPDLAVILPRADPQPSWGFSGHVSRAAYGFARTVAFLPSIRELRPTLAVPYMGLTGGGFLLFCHLARRGFLAHLGEQGKLLTMLACVATPFVLIGVCYYPSDPERWLFLMPALWLLIGLAWDRYERMPGRRIIAWDSPILLIMIVIGLGTYNAAALLPGTLANRNLAGLRELSRLTTLDDLVISPAGVKSRINEFYLNSPIQAENLTAVALVHKHGPNLPDMQADLADRIDRAFRDGRQVLVFGFIGEGHKKQRGYPWVYLEHDYGPDTFLAVLDMYQRDPIARPTDDCVGIFRLHPIRGSEDTPALNPGERRK